MKFTARLLALGLTFSTAYGMEKEDYDNLKSPSIKELTQSVEKGLESSEQAFEEIDKIAAKAQELLQKGDEVLIPSSEILKKMVKLSNRLTCLDTVSAAEEEQLKQDYLQLKDQLDKHIKTAEWEGVKLFSEEPRIAYPQVNAIAGVTGNGATIPLTNSVATGLNDDLKSPSIKELTQSVEKGLESSQQAFEEIEILNKVQELYKKADEFFISTIETINTI